MNVGPPAPLLVGRSGSIFLMIADISLATPLMSLTFAASIFSCVKLLSARTKRFLAFFAIFNLAAVI